EVRRRDAAVAHLVAEQLRHLAERAGEIRLAVGVARARGKADAGADSACVQNPVGVEGVEGPRALIEQPAAAAAPRQAEAIVVAVLVEAANTERVAGAGVALAGAV